MNEHVDFERLVAGHIADEGASAPSDAFYDELFTRAGGSGQRPEWLAFIKEPPMRTNNHVAVGSPTVRVMAILAATLLLALALAAAGAGAQRLLAADGPIVVAQDGSGHFETIQAAVDAADAGTVVQVQPGSYVESVVIDQSITLRGDGAREEVSISAPDDGPTSMTGVIAGYGTVPDQYALLIVETDAMVSGLTISGDRSALHVVGGSPTIEDLFFDDAGAIGATPQDSALVLTGGTKALVRDNLFEGGGNLRVFDQSEPILEGNLILDGPTLAGNFGDAAIVRHNIIRGSAGNGIAIVNPTVALFEDNTIEDVGGYAFAFYRAGTSEGDYRPTIIANTITRGLSGVQSLADGSPIIEGNHFNDLEQIAIGVSGDASVTNNGVAGSGIGIQVSRGAPTISDNLITEGEVGLALFAAADAVFTDNTVCDNETNLRLVGDAKPPDGDANEICADAAE